MVFALETMYVVYMVRTEFLYTIFTPMQEEDFSLNLALKCVR